VTEFLNQSSARLIAIDDKDEERLHQMLNSNRLIRFSQVTKRAGNWILKSNHSSRVLVCSFGGCSDRSSGDKPYAFEPQHDRLCVFAVDSRTYRAFFIKKDSGYKLLKLELDSVE